MRWFGGVAVALVAALASLATAVPLAAHEEKTAHITLVHPWSRPAPQGQNGVIYLEIRNGGAADDRLIAVSTPLAEKIELHWSTMEDGIHRMEKVESIVVPAGGAVELTPGGLHVMLISLKFMLMAEETVPVTLTFERAGDVTATFAVETPSGGDSEYGH